MSDNAPHIPVMLDEVIEHLNPQDGDVIVDCTFGAGGYTRALLTASNCRVIAIDRDPNVMGHVNAIENDFGNERFNFALTDFSEISNVIQRAGLNSVDGIVADLGVSSMQLDDTHRGFSFLRNAPLDMRMDSDHSDTAEDLVNSMPVAELRHLIGHYGEERYAGRIATAIDRARMDARITHTVQLADIIRDAVPAQYKNGALHPATRTFQAIRIAVNDELGHIERLLGQIPSLLGSGGRFVCVSFHSLEDGLVKQALRSGYAPDSSGSRYLPEIEKEAFTPIWSKISKKPLQPTENECENNNRARSSRLRWAVRS